ncbi:MAG: archaeosortase/exosortase family protein, partial [Nitrospirota bacterium]|nr:archaeosortase/exosortase family protein [Nitrospirota bacterium]
MNSTIDTPRLSKSRIPLEGIYTVLLIGLLGFLYNEILVGLVYDWDTDPNYSHGFLVPFMSAYFLWERWKQLTTLTIKPNGWGIPLLG